MSYLLFPKIANTIYNIFFNQTQGNFMTEAQKPETVTIDDEIFNLSDLPENVLAAIDMVHELEHELLEANKAVFKTKCAIRGLSTDISQTVKTSGIKPVGKVEQPTE